jgi:hypothetical protein
MRSRTRSWNPFANLSLRESGFHTSENLLIKKKSFFILLLKSS